MSKIKYQYSKSVLYFTDDDSGHPECRYGGSGDDIERLYGDSWEYEYNYENINEVKEMWNDTFA